MDYNDWVAFAHHEATGEYPDEVYIPTEEDLADPDHMEVAALVIEQYASNNAAKQERRAARRISILENALRDNGIEVPE
jgi:hypothetical protein